VYQYFTAILKQQVTNNYWNIRVFFRWIFGWQNSSASSAGVAGWGSTFVCMLLSQLTVTVYRVAQKSKLLSWIIIKSY